MLDLLILFSVAILLLLFLRSRNSRTRKLLDKIPDADGAYPIIGHLLLMLKTPEERFVNYRKRSAKHYPVYKLRVLNKTFVHIMQPEDVELLLKNHTNNQKSEIYDLVQPWLHEGLLTSFGAKWQKRRKILTPAFHFNILTSFVDIFNSEVAGLIRNLEKSIGKSVNIVEPATEYGLSAIVRTSMGVDLNSSDGMEAAQKYKTAVNRMQRSIVSRVARPWLYKETIYGLTKDGKEAKELIGTLHGFTSRIIEERKQQFYVDPNEGTKGLALLDMLLKYQSEGADLDKAGLLEEIETFMFAGHDSTATATTFTLFCLANFPEIQEKVLKEMEDVLGDTQAPSYTQLLDLKYTDRVVKETFRLLPVVPLISRVLGEDLETASGYLIPKGTNVHVMIIDMHRNPRIFPEPHIFDPDRWLPENVRQRHPFSFIPFSAGPRNCLGQKFAMLEIKAALSGIVRKFVIEKIDSIEDIAFNNDIVMRPSGPIRMKFLPRS